MDDDIASQNKPETTEVEEEEKAIQERIKKWKKKKEEWHNRRKSCPFGCGKSWKNIQTASVKRHLLEKCHLRQGKAQLP